MNHPPSTCLPAPVPRLRKQRGTKRTVPGSGLLLCCLWCACGALLSCTSVEPQANHQLVSSAAATRLADQSGVAVTPYPFDHCAVIQKPFRGGEAKYRRVYQGQEVLLCCTPCLNVFDAAPDAYMPRILEAVAATGTGETDSPVSP